MAGDITVPLDLFPVVKLDDRSETLRRLILLMVETLNQQSKEIEELREAIAGL
jgi:hypothetical protein